MNEMSFSLIIFGSLNKLLTETNGKVRDSILLGSSYIRFPNASQDQDPNYHLNSKILSNKIKEIRLTSAIDTRNLNVNSINKRNEVY